MDKQILTILNEYSSAVWEKDENKFLELHDPGIHSYDAWEKWEYQGMDQYRVIPEEWFSSLGDERVKVTFVQPKLNLDQRLATIWCHVVYAAFDSRGNYLRSLTNRLTMILRRQPDGWKILHEHLSVPVDFESGTGLFFNDQLNSSDFEDRHSPAVGLPPD